MFARPNAQHCQVAYVTNDIEAAAAAFQRGYDAPGFYQFTNVGTGADAGGPQLKIGLVRVGGIEIELIEPIGDTAPLFKDALPDGPELAIRFHHVAIRIEGPLAHWDAHIATIDFDKHPIAFEGALGDQLRFLYTDERATLGHYVEHVWLAPDLYAHMLAVTPTYPPVAIT
jgi:hypothetical protein